MYNEKVLIDIIDLCNRSVMRAARQLHPELIQKTKGKEDRQEYGYYVTDGWKILKLAEVLKQLKVTSMCDLGCGMGLLLHQLHYLQLGIKFSGIDNERILLKLARELTYHDDINFQHGDLTDLQAGEIKNIDCFYMWEPLITLRLTKLFLKSLLAGCKDGAYIIYLCSGRMCEVFNSSKELIKVEGFTYFQDFSTIETPFHIMQVKKLPEHERLTTKKRSTKKEGTQSENC